MLLDQIVSGLSSGILYALVALGFAVIFTSMDLVHFAQGEMFMLGGFVGYSLYQHWHVPFLLALVGSLAATGILGALLERFVYRRLARKDVMIAVICTIGVSLLLMNAARLYWGPSPLAVPKEQIAGAGGIHAGNVYIEWSYLFIITVALLLMLAFTYVFKRTKIGLAIRMAAWDPKVAALMGINVSRTYAITFGIGTALAGGAGWLLAPLTFIQYDGGQVIGMKAFAAAILGGTTSIPGAVVGGVLIGLIESIGAGMISSGAKDAIAFVVMIVILLVKPSGLLGKNAVEKV